MKAHVAFVILVRGKATTINNQILIDKMIDGQVDQQIYKFHNKGTNRDCYSNGVVGRKNG